ncbi:MAG: MerR family transcriptional regulator [Janthinobacterium lividum]
MEKMLPQIPVKRYFTIGEVGELCGVKPHVLRYWEQEFTQLRPMKRRGNRRYYQHHEVLMIRRIRDLLYDQGFTISGARNKLQELSQSDRERRRVLPLEVSVEGVEATDIDQEVWEAASGDQIDDGDAGIASGSPVVYEQDPPELPSALSRHECQRIRRELVEIRELLLSGF